MPLIARVTCLRMALVQMTLGCTSAHSMGFKHGGLLRYLQGSHSSGDSIGSGEAARREAYLHLSDWSRPAQSLAALAASRVAKMEAQSDVRHRISSVLTPAGLGYSDLVESIATKPPPPPHVAAGASNGKSSTAEIGNRTPTGAASVPGIAAETRTSAGPSATVNSSEKVETESGVTETPEDRVEDMEGMNSLLLSHLSHALVDHSNPTEIITIIQRLDIAATQLLGVAVAQVTALSRTPFFSNGLF